MAFEPQLYRDAGRKQDVGPSLTIRPTNSINGLLLCGRDSIGIMLDEYGDWCCGRISLGLVV
jgi:hypothetical protein